MAKRTKSNPPEAEDPSPVIDRIYALATELDGITGTTELLARITRSRSCGLLIQNRDDFRVVGGWFSGMDLVWGLAYRDRYFRCDPTVVEHFSIAPGEAYASRFHHEDAAFRKSEFFRDWCEPQKLGYFAGIYLELSPQQTLRLTFQGDLSRGQYEPSTLALMEAVLPHLKRAIDVNRRVTQLVGQSKAFESALETSRNAIVLLDLDGKVVHVNSIAAQTWGAELALRNGRVHVADAKARQQFELAVQGCVVALREAGASSSLQAGVHVALPRLGLMPLSLYLAPFRLLGLSPHTPMPPDLIMLQIVDPEHQIGLDSERLREVLDLTPAEARVAAHLCRGNTAEKIGERLKLSPHTVRDHIKHIYLRTGVSKQSEFVARAYSVLRLPAQLA
jgi:DNA-binding CsgD family transcriptional regulator/PAS domain-containing protein